MSATIADVARTAGVSPGTVSNVLNHPHRVKVPTLQRVERAIHLLGYRPNRQARMLAGGRDHGIGLVVHDTGNPFFARLADAIDDSAGSRGFNVVMVSSRADDARQEAAVRLLAEHQLSGILLTPTVHSPDQVMTFAGGTPVVLLDYPGKGEVCSVSSNDRLGGRLAAQHLVDNGHRRICYVGGPRRVRQHRDRVAGARAVLKGGVAALQLIHTEADTLSNGQDVARQVRDLLPQLDAVMCGNDLLAIGLISELARLGVRVPDDLSVIGYDDTELAPVVTPKLTTVHQPVALMGQLATEMLISEILEADHRHRTHTVEPQLVVRDSVRLTFSDG